MLESKVHQEYDQGEDHSGHQDKQSRALELAPSGPRDLLGQFRVAVFKIIDESHLCF